MSKFTNWFKRFRDNHHSEDKCGTEQSNNPQLPKFESIRVEHCVILFPPPRYHFGQQVFLKDGSGMALERGVVVGMRRDKYTWKYIVVQGYPPLNGAEEKEFDELELK